MNKFLTIDEAREARGGMRLVSRTGTVHSMNRAMLIVDRPEGKPFYYRGEALADGETVRVETSRSDCGAMGQIRANSRGFTRHGAASGITVEAVTCKRCGA